MKQRNINLDVLRIYAAFMVLSVHIAIHIGRNFDVGAMGVQLFFMLSGYLAFASLEKNDSISLYYKNRLVRILPTYYFCLTMVYLEDLFVAIHDGTFPEVLKEQCSIKFLRYVFFIHCFTPSDNWNLWNNHSALWTMSSFVGFYLIAPWLYRAIKNCYIGIVAVILMMVCRPQIIETIQNRFASYPAESHIEYFAAMNPLTELYCFLLGAVLFLAIRERKQYIYSGILVIISVVFSLRWYPYEIVFLLLILLSVVSDNVTDNRRIKDIIVWLSRGSFTLYLIHPLILNIEARVWYKFGIQVELIHGIFLYTWCVLISYVLYYGVIVRIERRISRKYNNESVIKSGNSFC